MYVLPRFLIVISLVCRAERPEKVNRSILIFPASSVTCPSCHGYNCFLYWLLMFMNIMCPYCHSHNFLLFWSLLLTNVTISPAIAKVDDFLVVNFLCHRSILTAIAVTILICYGSLLRWLGIYIICLFWFLLRVNLIDSSFSYILLVRFVMAIIIANFVSFCKQRLWAPLQ
jgi:hypothetical protein